MDNNIALITALFNEKGSNFYKDIYFPIIRYSLISLFKEHRRNERYFKIRDLREFIKNKFFIEIPVVVLRNSVVAMGGNTQTNIYVETLGKQNDNIYIKRIEDDQETDAVIKEAEKIEDNFTLLENLFQQYLNAEQLDCNTNLYDFISEYEDECYSMIVGDEMSQVDGIDASFSNTARFIDWLKNNRQDLYQCFTNIVWGAIISAFLRRKQFESSIKPNDRVSYYLDTSLVLALYNLDTEYNAAYAKDIIQNVKASGGIIKVHGITLHEVTRILTSVINDQGPRFGTAIAYGFEENNLDLSYVLSLKNSLETKLNSDFGITIDPFNQQKIDEINRKFEKNKNVLYLGEKWGVSAQDKFREKHDVFMCETVSKINEGVVNIEKMKGFFITLNRDLIELYHKPEGLSSVITPGNAILKLWIHGTQIANIRSYVLTEMVSRSMALAQTDARRKIKLFCKYRKKANISAQDISDMYGSLIYRSNNVLMKFNELEQLDQSDNTDDKDEMAAVMMNGILDGVHQESERRNKLFEEQVQSKQKMIDDMGKLENSLKAITEEKNENDKVIIKLQEENANNQLLIKQLEDEIDKKQKESELTNKLQTLRQEKGKMEAQRDMSISTFSYWVKLSLDIILILALIIFTVLFIKNYFSVGKIELNLRTSLTAITFLGFLFRVKDAYWLNPKIKFAQCKKEQTDYWEDHHPEYNEIKEQISEVERSINGVKFNRKRNE